MTELTRAGHDTPTADTTSQRHPRARLNTIIARPQNSAEIKFRLKFTAKETKRNNYRNLFKSQYSNPTDFNAAYRYQLRIPQNQHSAHGTRDKSQAYCDTVAC